MINTTVEKWDEIVQEDSKLRRFEGKSFPLFDALDFLYDGNIAQGKRCLTSSQPPPSTSRKRPRDDIPSMTNLPPRIGVMTSQRIEIDPPEDEGQNMFSDVERMGAAGRSHSYQSHNDELMPQGGDEDQDVQRSCDQSNSRSANSGAQSGRPKKQKGATSFSRIEETMSDFVKLKREQAGMKEQASIQGQQYSIPSCLQILNAMDDVSDEIKVLASDVFKDAANRELFVSYDARLRGLWLKKEVAKLGIQLPQ